MAPNPDEGGALSPVPGALTDFMKSMLELSNDKMPDVVVHEYNPLLDSSDMVSVGQVSSTRNYPMLSSLIIIICWLS